MFQNEEEGKEGEEKKRRRERGESLPPSPRGPEDMRHQKCLSTHPKHRLPGCPLDLRRGRGGRGERGEEELHFSRRSQWPHLGGFLGPGSMASLSRGLCGHSVRARGRTRRQKLGQQRESAAERVGRARGGSKRHRGAPQGRRR